MLDENKIRFDEKISFFEDEIFTLELFRYAKSFSRIDDVFYQYRILESSLTRSRKWDYLPIGRRFISEGVVACWKGLKDLAYCRARYFMRAAMRQKNGYLAAGELIEAEKRYGVFDGVDGKFAKTAHRLASTMPATIGGAVLWGLDKFVVRGGVDNALVYEENDEFSADYWLEAA